MEGKEEGEEMDEDRKGRGCAAPDREPRACSGTSKRQRLGGGLLAVGVRDAIYEEIEVGAKTTRFGVVSYGTPFWEWAVPAGGRLVWVWGASLGDQFRERSGTDMWLEKDMELEDLAPVDVILFEGAVPNSTHAVWKLGLESVNVIVWFGGNRRCRPPSAPPSADSYWSVEQTALDHGTLGGVTSLVTHFWVARRLSVSTTPRTATRAGFLPPIGLSGASLGRVVKPTLPGRACTAPSMNEFDAARMPLDWRHRDDYLKLPSVFHRATGGFVRRQLSDKELLAAMDVPASVLKQASTEDLREWKDTLSVPFKSRFEIIRSVITPAAGSSESSAPLSKSQVPSTGLETTRSKGPSREIPANTGDVLETKEAARERAAYVKDPDEQEAVHATASKTFLTAAKSDDAEIPVKCGTADAARDVHQWKGPCARTLGLLRP